MQRIVVHRPGGYDRLRLEEHPSPRPGEGEVLVDVRAIGVNYADVVIRLGLYASAREYVGWPITPGFEIAGVVRERGPGASRFEPGQEVFGVTRFGGYATQLAVSEHQLFARPSALSLTEAAGFPTVFLTAHYALGLADPRRGSQVLVHSAAGGVGGALVQLARASGLRTVAVVGAPHKAAAAREAGADEVVDKSQRDLWTDADRLSDGKGYAAVFDANGVSTLLESYRRLAPGGRLVIYGFHSMLPRKGGRLRWLGWLRLAWDYWRTPRFNPMKMTNRNRSVMAFNLSYLFDERDLLEEKMAELVALLEAGKIHAPSVATYPLAEVARAHRDLESGQTVGKLVLIP